MKTTKQKVNGRPDPFFTVGHLSDGVDRDGKAFITLYGGLKTQIFPLIYPVELMGSGKSLLPLAADYQRA